MLPKLADTPEPLVVFLKSYGLDVEYSKRFLASFQKHNADNLPLFVVVPEEDLPAFAFFEEAGAPVLSESLFAPYLATEAKYGNSIPYTNHQVIRMSFWELGLAENYLNVDSELVFVRDFHRSDFMVSDSVPYTFLSEDFELQVDHAYYLSHWTGRLRQFAAMKQAMGWSERRSLTVHGMAVYSAKVWGSLKRDFLEPRGMTYLDALSVSAIPPTWHSFWAQKSQVIPVVMKEPWFKFFHNAGQHLEYVVKDITHEDIARAYVAVNVNTGYSRQYGMLEAEDSKARVLGSYLSLGVLAKALVWRWLGRTRGVSPQAPPGRRSAAARELATP